MIDCAITTNLLKCLTSFFKETGTVKGTKMILCDVLGLAGIDFYALNKSSVSEN